MLNRWTLEAAEELERRIGNSSSTRLKKLIVALELLMQEPAISKSWLAGDLNMLMVILEELMVKNEAKFVAPHFQKPYLKKRLLKKRREEANLESSKSGVIDG